MTDTQRSSSQTPDYPENIDAAVLKIAGVVILGVIMSILDITVVNVALPTFQEEFGSEAAPLAYSHVAWTVTAYTLALATVIPLTGWAADRFGTKRLFIAAIALFTAGSVLCAAAQDINTLIAFRVLQGLGGGMIMPLGMTIMTRAAGPHRMGRLMAILGIPMLLGPILGPIVGGWLIEHASWHWIFLINLPIGIGVTMMATRLVPTREGLGLSAGAEEVDSVLSRIELFIEDSDSCSIRVRLNSSRSTSFSQVRLKSSEALRNSARPLPIERAS